jgi:uncharacterized protein (DUF433 family)
MQLEDYFDFLSSDDIRIRGHRIGIESVLYESIFRARTPEEIADCFPSLSQEQILATLLYYQRNKAQVDAYLSAWIEFGERMRAEQARHPTPAMLRLRKLRAEREAAKPTLHQPQPA